MKANPRFLGQPNHFWAHVRTVGEQIGYTSETHQIKVPAVPEIKRAFANTGLNSSAIVKGK